MTLLLFLVASGVHAGQITYTATGHVGDVSLNFGAAPLSTVNVGDTATFTFTYDSAAVALGSSPNMASYDWAAFSILLKGSTFDILPSDITLGLGPNAVLQDDFPLLSGQFQDDIQVSQQYSGSLPMSGPVATELTNSISPTFGFFGFVLSNTSSSASVSPLTSTALPALLPDLSQWASSSFVIQTSGSGGSVIISGPLDSLQAVPEPRTFALVFASLVGLVLLRRRLPTAARRWRRAATCLAIGYPLVISCKGAELTRDEAKRVIAASRLFSPTQNNPRVIANEAMKTCGERQGLWRVNPIATSLEPKGAAIFSEIHLDAGDGNRGSIRFKSVTRTLLAVTGITEGDNPRTSRIVEISYEWNWPTEIQPCLRTPPHGHQGCSASLR